MSEMDEVSLRVEAMRLAVKVYTETPEDLREGIVAIAESIFKFIKSGE